MNDTRVLTTKKTIERLGKRALCKDCGRDTEKMGRDGSPRFLKWDMYIVRGRIWAEAGMLTWNAGFLCQKCLSKRLGRDLKDEDYLCRPVGARKDSLQMVAKPEYAAWVNGGCKGPLPW